MKKGKRTREGVGYMYRNNKIRAKHFCLNRVGDIWVKLLSLFPLSFSLQAFARALRRLETFAFNANVNKISGAHREWLKKNESSSIHTDRSIIICFRMFSICSYHTDMVLAHSLAHIHTHSNSLKRTALAHFTVT